MSAKEFEALYRAHERDMRRVAKHYAGSEADDVLQDALMRAWRSRDRFTMGTDFAAWMNVIIRNRAFDVRKQKRREEIFVPCLEFIGVVEHDRDFHEYRNRKDGIMPPPDDGLSDEVQTALNELPGEFREALLMQADGVGGNKACEEVGVHPSTFRTRACRAKKIMRRSLREYGALRGFKLNSPPNNAGMVQA